MVFQRRYDNKLIQYVSLWNLSWVYSAIVIFALLRATYAIKIPVSLNSQRSKVYLPHINRNSDWIEPSMLTESVKNMDYVEQLTINNKEDEYFHPDTILFHPNDRKTDSFGINSDNNTYILFNELSIGKYPVKPKKFPLIKLPKPDYQPKFVEHKLHKNLWPVDLESRKIFLRDNK